MEKGHAVETALERGLSRAGDDEVLLHAAIHRQILVTHNIKDFELLHDAWRRWSAAWSVNQPHAGVLILPQPRPAEALAELLGTFLALGLPLDNALYRWRSTAGWQMRP